MKASVLGIYTVPSTAVPILLMLAGIFTLHGCVNSYDNSSAQILGQFPRLQIGKHMVKGNTIGGYNYVLPLGCALVQ